MDTRLIQLSGSNAKRSTVAEQRFRELVTKLGGVLVEPVWLGTQKPHRITCSKGHAFSAYPTNVLRGRGFCRRCSKADYYRSRSEGAWRQFQDTVSRLGGSVIEPEWIGSGRPHRVICSAGHQTTQAPNSLQQGGGLCRICSGLDPADSEQRFREEVERRGARVVEPAWLGVHRPHRVICAAGHECAPYPGRVRDGGGLCRICARSSSDAFYLVENEPRGAIKLGITTGDGAERLRRHRYSGFTVVLRYLQELDDAAFLEAHTLRTLKAAGIKPVRGLEYFDRAPALPVVLDVVDNWT